MSKDTHIPDTELVDAYITGGLAAEERLAFESHLRDCPACQAAVEVARSSDDSLRQMFQDARPAVGFEDRLIRAVRQQGAATRMRIPLPVRQAAAVAAAVLLVGSVGYVGNNFLTGNGSLAQRVHAASNLQEIGRAILHQTGDDVGVGSAMSSSARNDSDFTEGLVSAGKPAQLAARNKSLDHDLFEEAKVPYGDILRYPTNRPEIAGEEKPPVPGFAPAGVDGHSDLNGNGDDNRQRRLFANGDVAEVSKRAEALDYSWFKPNEYAQVDAKAGLDKVGLGRTSLSGANTYTGKTTIDSGTLSLGKTVQPPTAKPSSPGAVALALNDVPQQLTVDQSGQGTEQAAGQAPVVPPVANPPAAVDTRKIIRNGTMEFEVDNFDSALAKITQIVTETGGFVGTVDSQKLPNGKVKGTVTVRMPPERLDVLVLSLRALGDLKSQQISAQDITKQYTDLQSQLTAARAMETRLLELIKAGNGAIKDLLAAEKELGVWREKIEKAEGEIRYYNNLVSLSTLSITVAERDIRTPAAATETETADVGIESEDVERARTDALKAIEDAKGRTIDSELKRFDAGQLAAKIIADVPPESAGPVIDRLKQLGRVARLEVHRQQTPADGSEPTTAGTALRVDRKPTRLLISLYNLANVAPRRTTNVTLAAADVESAYNTLLSQAKADAGRTRVVTSTVDRGDPIKAIGSLVLEVPPDKLDAALSVVRGQGDVLKLAVVENADTQNTTDAKQGLTIQLISLAAVKPRETVQQAVASQDVPAAYHAVLDAAGASHARVVNARLSEEDRRNVSAAIEVEVPRSESAAIDKALAGAGETVSRSGSRLSDTDNTVDSKVLLRLSIVSAERLPPRESTTMEVEVTDAAKASGDAQAAVVAAGGTVAEANASRDRSGRQVSHVVFDVPLAKAGDVLNQLRSAGTVRQIESSRDNRAPTGPLAHARIDATFATADAIVTGESTLWTSIRNGLGTSIAGLLLSVRLLVIGLCLVGPWALVLWVAVRMWRRRRKSVVA